MTIRMALTFLGLCFLTRFGAGVPGLGFCGLPGAGGKSTSSQNPKGPAPKPSNQSPPATPAEQSASREVFVTVVDENRVPVPSTRLTLTKVEGQVVSRIITGSAGQFKFTGLEPGLYRLRVEKEGFYSVELSEVRVGETESVEVTLNHQQEYVEVMNVAASPPAIDPAKTASTEKLDSREIVNLPYPVTRDIRYALPLLPGVLQDATGQVHVAGSSAHQTIDALDGFNVTDPASGLFKTRVNVDALRAVEIQDSRASAENGKGSGGFLNLTTGIGDDHFRFSGTNFLPGIQSRKGIHLNTWTPRLTFSGPVRKGKAWFLVAPDGEYNLNIVKELPRGADQNSSWRAGNLAKAQWNWSESNFLTTSFLINRSGSKHAGLSSLSPLETTLNLDELAYLFTTKNQSRLPNGMLLEMGFGISRFHTDQEPLGHLPYVIRPDGTSGNFFRSAEAHTGRLQWILNVISPPLKFHGRHEFKAGLDLDRITDSQFSRRGPISILREDGTLAREVNFIGSPAFHKNNFEASAYAQDRWSVSERFLLESGVRFDRDDIVRRVALSPRLATTYLLSRKGDTKLAAGIGLYYDGTNLDLITVPLAGRRIDLFFDPLGQTLVRPPLETTFVVNQRNLLPTRFLNWSVELERRLPRSVYLSAGFLEKRGQDGWTFINGGPGTGGEFTGLFELRNDRRDRYDAFQVTARRTFRGEYTLLGSYTRSAARSNAVLDFNIDNPIFSPQAGGPLPWDSPNRFLTWGWLPLKRGFELAYSLDWRDGYPFSLVNQNQELVGPPGSRRFPYYFSLDLHLERRFRLLGLQWAARAGFNNITNRHNPAIVNNNVDSPRFLTFGAVQDRVFTGRIRLLGRK